MLKLNFLHNVALGLLGQGETGLTGIDFKDLHISSNAPCAIWRTLIDDL